MIRRRALLAAGLALPALWRAGPARAAADWEAFVADGAVALMRHALAPGTGDPPGFTLGRCATQRTLSDAGRDQARRIGAALRDRGIGFDQVITSRWCRCRETAELMDVGPVVPQPAFDSFFQDRGARAERTAAARALIAGAEGRILAVTHQVNISALTGTGTSSGEIVIARPATPRMDILGRVRIPA